MSIADKLETIAKNIPKIHYAGHKIGYEGGYSAGFYEGTELGYSDGFSAGEESEITKWRAKHYTEVKLGDGTNKFTVDCGFEPDFFMVLSSSSYAYTKPNVISSVYQDFRSMGRLSAYRRYTKATGDAGNATITTSSAVRFFPFEKGKVSYDGSQATSETSRAYVFDENTYYTAVCVKYTDKSDAEILRELVTALPDTGGTVEVSEIKVNGAFADPDEEWQMLIATKPNWTFVLV